MKLKYLLLACFSGLIFGQNTYQTPYEKGNGNQSVTYDEMNTFYRDLSKNFKSIQYLQKREDDNGEPIYVVIFNPFKETEYL